MASLLGSSRAGAELPKLVQPEDIYRVDEVSDAITLPDGRSAVYCRRYFDSSEHAIRQSIWREDDQGPARPLEEGEPNAFRPQLSPDGKWILFLSTRPFPDGSPAFDPVPPYSDTAADIWLVPVSGGRAVPLGGASKPYGRVMTDSFYGRVAFSPDGRRLAFVADEGAVRRTDEERRANVVVVRADQGEGYEGYGPAQIWVADLLEAPAKAAAGRISRVTPDEFWYGDPQWSPDGSFIVACANRTAEQEPVRFNINQNFDLWKIDLSTRRMEQLTTGPGPEFSPRIAPDGRRLVCLSSPRRGPHLDVFNLMVVDLTADRAKARVVFDFHGPAAGAPPHLPPTFPLPDRCWRDSRHITFTAYHGLRTEPQCVDLDGGPEAVECPPGAPPARPLLPASNDGMDGRIKAPDRIVQWESSDGLGIDGVLTLPPARAARPPYKLLVIAHGGPHSRATSGAGFDVQLFAANGYAVFQPNFRGSSGYGVKFLDADRNDFGGGDMRDILTGVDYLVGKGLADGGRQFIFGASYGGFMTAWLVGHTHQFRAAAMLGAATDLNAFWHLSDIQSWTEWEFGGLPSEVGARMNERSPLQYASRVRTPTLVMASLNDRRCPIAMSRMYYNALKKAGVDAEMVVYPDEGHVLRTPQHQEDMLRRVLDWFARHDVQRAGGARPEPMNGLRSRVSNWSFTSSGKVRRLA